MAILVVAGDPGNGKGIFAMSLVEQFCKARRPLYTNIRLTPQCPYYDQVVLVDDADDDAKSEAPVYRGVPPHRDRLGKLVPASADYCAFWHYMLPGSALILDEADTYFDCTDHSVMGRDVRLFLKQHRKLGLDLIFIVQRIENLYIRIRRLTQRFIVCEWNWRSMRMFQRIFAPMAGFLTGSESSAMRLSKFMRSEFSSETLSPSSYLGDGAISYREAQKYFTWYTTEQLLGDTSHLQWMKPRAELLEVVA